MKNHLALLLLLPACAAADFLNEEDDGYEYRGPTKSEIELIEVQETSPYGSEGPLSVQVKNNSDFFLDRVAIQCTISDQRGFRVFKDMVFRSGPIFSVRIDFPPFWTPEMGIPPGAVSEVGLYTDDNRWTRGNGAYRYDCQMYGVSGRT